MEEESANWIGYKAFEEYSPCIYEGLILCKHCRRYKTCDMRAGRELHEKYFVQGFILGQSKCIEV